MTEHLTSSVIMLGAFARASPLPLSGDSALPVEEESIMALARAAVEVGLLSRDRVETYATHVSLRRAKHLKVCSGFSASRVSGVRFRAFHSRSGLVKTASASPIVQAAVVQALPKEFGYVVLTIVSSAVLTQWQSIEVAKQRRKIGLPYPKVCFCF